MKSKLLALAVILSLCLSVFAVAFQGAFATEWRVLTISYLPSDMPPPATVPALGTYNLSKGSTITLEAPQYVYADSDVRYRFDAWCFYNEETGSWSNSSTNPRTVTLNYNYTAYARYVIQYKVTVEVPSSPDWEANFTAWVWDPVHGWQTNHNTTVSTWVDNGTQVMARIQGQGMFGPSPAMPGVWRKGKTAYARFENWTGIGVYSIDSVNFYAHSNWITVTGPTQPAVEWAMYYKLDISYVPSSIGGPWSSWEKECREVTISASTTGRWAPEYIEVDGVKVPANTVGTPPCVVYCNYTFTTSYVNLTITVHMDDNHTVVVHWTRRTYLTFQDSGCPSGASGVSKYTGYYFPGWNYTFTAPPYTNETACYRWRFNKWWVPGVGWVGNLTHRDFTLTVGTTDITITAYYLLQWRVRLFTDPPGLIDEGIPLKLTGDVPEGSGWFDHDTVASFGAPEYFGEAEWNNGTRYAFVKWVYDSTGYSWSNETWWKVTTCRNFTAVYKKQFSVEVSAEPADFSWEKTYWADENGPTKIVWATSMWTDPKGLKYYFDHWEVIEGPSAGLLYPTSNWLWLNMTSPYKVKAVYRNGTALIAAQDEAYFVGAGGAYCQEFDITMMVLNIEGMFAAEFKLTWDASYLELSAVDTTPLDSVWTNYFIAKGGEVPATPGEYEFVATALGNDTEPFSGTAALVTLTFHIIKEPEDPVGPHTITIHIASYRFLNKTGAEISIDYTGDGQCTIETPQPYLKMSSKIEDCGKTMIVFVEAQNVTRLFEYQARIIYPSSQLKVVDITVEKTFLQGPYSVQTITFDGGYITIHVKQASGVPPANGTGILAIITFEILVGPGVSIDPLTWDTANTWIKELKNPDGTSLTLKYPELGLKESETPKQIPGDANMDGIVDIFDLRLVALYYGKNYKPADFDNDGIVDLDDLLITAIHFGESMYE